MSDKESGEGGKQRAAQDRGHINPARWCVEEIKAQGEPGLPTVFSVKISHLIKPVPIMGLNPREFWRAE